MKTLFRVAVAVIGGMATWYFLFWLGAAAMSFVTSSPWIAVAASALGAIAAARYLWTQTASVAHSLVSSTLVSALITGGISFFAGFVGPMFIWPEADLAPPLGAFIMGLLGFLVGALGGAVHWFARNRRPRTTGPGDAA